MTKNRQADTQKRAQPEWQTLSPPPSGFQTGTLVIQPSEAIGDNIWFVSVLRALAASDPSGRIDLITHSYAPVLSILGNQQIINRYFLAPLPTHQKGMKRRAARKKGIHTLIRHTVLQFVEDVRAPHILAKALGMGRYQRAFIFWHYASYVRAARDAGIPAVYNNAGVGWRNPLPNHNHKYFRKPNPDRLPALLDIWGIPHVNEPPRLTPSPAAVRDVKNFYADLAAPWIGFAIGSTTETRMWPPERFAAVADHLWGCGYRALFLLGAPHESAIARAIIGHCQMAKPVAVTDRPLEQVIALVSLCAFTLCNDSGLMNVSAAVGIPVYAMFPTVKPYTYSPHIRPIMPEGGIDKKYGAKKITVERVLGALQGSLKEV